MIEKRMTHITPFGLDRCLHIYLPDDYASSGKSYPVLYMFDGHNLYLDSDATYGHAWHISDQYTHHHVEMIVVGLECNHEGRERLNEFCPYVLEKSRLGSLDGRGQPLMNWMAHALRAEIDAHYRTNGKNYLGGSSMGGLMALYGMIAYGDVYQGAACLSSSIFLCMNELKEEIRHASHLKGAKIYMSYGSEEARSKEQLAAIVKGHMALAECLKQKQAEVYFDMIVNGGHNEATWETQVMDFTRYLEADQ